MIIDTLDNLRKYTALNPLFSAVCDYLEANDLNGAPLGKISLQGSDLFINVAQTSPKTVEEARLETHRQMIDIQIPLSGDETMGYTPLCKLPQAPYDEAKDIAFYQGKAEAYFTLRPGMFAIFFPQDAHAPGISAIGVKKLIVKVLA
jgi:biofilm protein TabA